MAGSNRLAGRAALVTGASTGIGRGVAIAYAAEGAAVAINYPDVAQEANARAVAQEIRAAGGRAICVRADVRSEAEIKSMMQQVAGEFGRIDILANNAGIARPKPVIEMTVEEWDDVLNVDLRGVFLCIKHALPGMLQRDYGRIINTASRQSFQGAAGFANYCAAKAGILGLTRALVLEIGKHNVTVNCVAPSMTRTAILGTVTEEHLERTRARNPMGRLGEVEDLTSTFIFLASEDIGYLTGQCLSPSGGGLMV